MKRVNKSLILIVSLLMGCSLAQMSLKSKGSDGWGYADRYEQRFNKFGQQTYYAEVKSIDTVTPFPNMAYGVQLTVTINKADCAVHLGPAWYILRQDAMNFSKGDNIEIKGAKVSINGKEVIMPSQITKKDRMLMLRDEDGVPYWCAWRKN